MLYKLNSFSFKGLPGLPGLAGFGGAKGAVVSASLFMLRWLVKIFVGTKILRVLDINDEGITKQFCLFPKRLKSKETLLFQRN